MRTNARPEYAYEVRVNGALVATLNATNHFSACQATAKLVLPEGERDIRETGLAPEWKSKLPLWAQQEMETLRGWVQSLQKELLTLTSPYKEGETCVTVDDTSGTDFTVKRKVDGSRAYFNTPAGTVRVAIDRHNEVHIVWHETGKHRFALTPCCSNSITLTPYKRTED